ncbi:hypothetical protein ACQY0O_003843 [Thecaphora frezii]
MAPSRTTMLPGPPLSVTSSTLSNAPTYDGSLRQPRTAHRQANVPRHRAPRIAVDTSGTRQPSSNSAGGPRGAPASSGRTAVSSGATARVSVQDRDTMLRGGSQAAYHVETKATAKLEAPEAGGPAYVGASVAVETEAKPLAAAASSSRRGFYIPPPGYNPTPTSSKLYEPPPHPHPQGVYNGSHATGMTYGYWPRPPSDWQPSFDDAYTTFSYGGHGDWRPVESLPGRWTWMPSIRSGHAGDSALDVFFSKLSHNDWTIPQAKQMLSRWATVAALLAGTQCTLLTIYDSQRHYTSIAFGFSALFFEIWGAVVATFCIVVSIMLQASDEQESGKPARDNDSVNASDTAHKGTRAGSRTGLHAASHTGTWGERHPKSKKRLSIRAACILDRLTLAVGWIIPGGAVLEVISIYTYVIQEHNGAVLYGLVSAMCVSISITLLQIGVGLWNGHVQQKRIFGPQPDKVRRRPMPDGDQQRGVPPGDLERGDGSRPWQGGTEKPEDPDPIEERDNCGLGSHWPLLGCGEHRRSPYGPDYADEDSEGDQSDALTLTPLTTDVSC